MTETLANGYSYVSTHMLVSYEYEHDRVRMVFKIICVLVVRMKETSALEGLSTESWSTWSADHCTPSVIRVFT